MKSLIGSNGKSLMNRLCEKSRLKSSYIAQVIHNTYKYGDCGSAAYIQYTVCVQYVEERIVMDLHWVLVFAKAHIWFCFAKV